MDLKWSSHKKGKDEILCCGQRIWNLMLFVVSFLQSCHFLSYQPNKKEVVKFPIAHLRICLLNHLFKFTLSNNILFNLSNFPAEKLSLVQRRKKVIFNPIVNGRFHTLVDLWWFSNCWSRQNVKFLRKHLKKSCFSISSETCKIPIITMKKTHPVLLGHGNGNGIYPL